VGQVVGFKIACKLYIRIKIREKSVKEQIQCILIYFQGGSAYI